MQKKAKIWKSKASTPVDRKLYYEFNDVTHSIFGSLFLLFRSKKLHIFGRKTGGIYWPKIPYYFSLCTHVLFWVWKQVASVLGSVSLSVRLLSDHDDNAAGEGSGNAAGDQGAGGQGSGGPKGAQDLRELCHAPGRHFSQPATRARGDRVPRLRNQGSECGAKWSEVVGQWTKPHCGMSFCVGCLTFSYFLET